MIISCGRPSNFQASELEVLVAKSDKRVRENLITAFALCIITIFLFSLAFALFGAGQLPPDITMGLGIFPDLSGALLCAVGTGIFIGAVAHFAIASVRHCQKKHWESIIT